MSLIRSKIRLPRWRANLLSRPRLVEYMRDNLTRKLILIVAPPGYGKTTLLLDFAHHGGVATSWYSLDEGDRDLRVFLEYLTTAIQQRFPAFGEKALTNLADFRPTKTEMARLIGILVNEMYETIDDEFIILLDHFEAVSDSAEISLWLEGLLRYLPDHIHIALASRTFPQRSAVTLPLIATGDVAGISGQLLRFNAAEVIDLADHVYDLELDLATADAIVQRCEGWIMGIQLSSDALRRRDLQSVLPAQVDNNLLFEYIAAEIFQPLQREQRDFLLRSSVLRPLTVGLAHETLGRSDADVVLRELTEQLPMLVIPLDGEGAYRYHGVLTEFLDSTLRRDPAGYRAVHEAAGHAQRKHGSFVEAIHHYLEAGRADEAADVATRAVDEWHASGRWETIRQVVAQLPSAERRPPILLAEALRLKEQGQNDAALLLLSEVETHGDSRSRIMARMRRANIWGLQGRHPAALAAFREALYSIDPSDRLLSAEAYRGLGRAQFGLGQTAAAIESFQTALRLFEESDSQTDVAHLCHELGWVYTGVGRLDDAHAAYRRALAHWETTTATAWPLATLNNLADLYHTQGRLREALEIHEQIGPAAREFGYSIVEAASRLTTGAIHADLHNFSGAIDALTDGLSLAERGDYAYLIVYGLDTLGNVYRQLGNLREARVHLEHGLALARERDLAYETALCTLSLGLLALEAGAMDDAAAALERSRDAFLQQGATPKVAVTEFGLARVAASRQDLSAARARLDEAATIATRLGYDHFLVEPASAAFSLLRWATRHTSHSDFWSELMRRVTQLQSSAETAPPPLVITTLGRARIQVGGEEQAPEWVGLREIFFYLLTQHPQGARRDQLLALFWPEATPANAAQALKVALYRLRRSLCQTRHEGGWYSLLLPEGYVYDVGQFQALAAYLDSPHSLTAEDAAALQQAVALYQGDYLPEYYSDWVITEREQLKQLYLRILSALGSYYEQTGEPAAALEYYQKSLTQDEYQETAHQGMMRCYMALGDRHRAVQHFREMVQVLRHDLGIEPAAETQRLFQQLMDGIA